MSKKQTSKINRLEHICRCNTSSSLQFPEIKVRHQRHGKDDCFVSMSFLYAYHVGDVVVKILRCKYKLTR